MLTKAQQRRVKELLGIAYTAKEVACSMGVGIKDVKQVQTKRRTEKQALRRARRTLRHLNKYFKLQADCAEAGIISPGLKWRNVYKDVSGMVVKWTGEALVESRVKI